MNRKGDTMSVKTKYITIDDLIEQVKTYDDNKENLELIKKAYLFAYKKHFGQKRISGDDYITHPLNVALILTEINADAYAISASLLHDTIEDSDATYEEINKEFGKVIADLVDGVTKINKLNFTSETEQMAANQRKILVGLSSDVRVIIIKLADRLHNMRTLYVLSEDKQKKKAKETLEILTPIAHRIGIYKIKSELEDLSLRYLKPDAYYDVVEKLNLKKSVRDDAVYKMMAEVSALLTEHNIVHEMKGRSKSIYSIYQKLNKGKTFDEIYDILALRVFVNTVQECYLALGLIHSKYKPVPKRFKDYIAMPKTNLYQSLHTTVFGIDGELFEIQIRTYEMDKIAEYGIASHWSYKENKSGNIKDVMDQKLQLFRNIIELNDSETSNTEFIDSIKKDVLTSDVIYVYTPKGDVIELPSGSTTVDFAYKVHSEVGDTMIGAIVNDNIVPLDYKLKQGDIIKINTNKTSKPSKDWLKFVVTANAKNRIRSYYKNKDKDNNLTKGINLLEKEIRKQGMSISDTLSNKNLDYLVEELKLLDHNELYISVGSGKFTPASVLRLLKKEEKESKDITTKINSATRDNIVSKNDILVEGIGEIKVSISNCCKPIPGDHIIGYITKGSGITVHRTNCKNIIDLDERLVNVKWNNITNKKYLTDIIVYTNSMDNMLDIIALSSTNNITIDSISTINKSEYKVYNMTVLVSDLESLNKYINQLENLKFVKKVRRHIN